MSTAERINERPRVPQYVENLNAIARACGFSVTGAYAEPYDGQAEIGLFAKWRGTQSQFRAIGLIPRFWQFPITAKSKSLTLPTTAVGRHARCILGGYVTATGPDTFVYEIDFGALPVSISSANGVETICYDDETDYHGFQEDLIATGICEPRHFPKKRGQRTEVNGAMNEAREWGTRRQPDGSFLYWLETEAAWQRRIQKMRVWMASARREPIQEPPAPKQRPAYLRLVVDNTKPPAS